MIQPSEDKRQRFVIYKISMGTISPTFLRILVNYANLYKQPPIELAENQ